MYLEINIPLNLKIVKVMRMIASDVAKKAYGRKLGNKQMASLVQEIELITGEACTSVIKHHAHAKTKILTLQYVPMYSAFKIIIMEHDPESDLSNSKQPASDEVPEGRYKFNIIKQLADKVLYTSEDGRNVLTIIKNLEYYNDSKAN